MTLHRSLDTPHMFYPSTAREAGVNAAIVEMAFVNLGFQGDGNPVDAELSDVIRFCSYLTTEEVIDAYKILIEKGILREVAR